MARRRFFVDEVHHGKAIATGDEAQHLRQVLRAELRQRYELSDGERVYLAEIEEFRKQTVTFRILEELPQPKELIHVTLAVALIKFDRLELMLEKATELGVSRIVVFPAVRSERGLEKAVPKRMERWQRISMEAAKQSHRVRGTEIEEAPNLAAICRIPNDLKFLLDEQGGAPILSAMPPIAKRTQGTTATLLLGPEGGWDERERQQALASGFVPLWLGQRILRAETAALSALSALQFSWDEALLPTEVIAVD
jgi:16S rRNA (uracil1498-N3)-methyltransferase